MGEFSISEAIQQFLNQSRIKGEIQVMQIGDVWEQIMGKTIARYTKEVKLKEGVLIIVTDVAPLKQELQFGKQQVINNINEYFGEKVVTDVVVK